MEFVHHIFLFLKSSRNFCKALTFIVLYKSIFTDERLLEKNKANIQFFCKIKFKPFEHQKQRTFLTLLFCIITFKCVPTEEYGYK